MESGKHYEKLIIACIIGNNLWIGISPWLLCTKGLSYFVAVLSVRSSPVLMDQSSIYESHAARGVCIWADIEYDILCRCFWRCRFRSHTASGSWRNCLFCLCTSSGMLFFLLTSVIQLPRCLRNVRSRTLVNLRILWFSVLLTYTCISSK